MHTPKADCKRYRNLVLDNGLKVMLVSSSDAEKAAMAVNVHAGSYNDPEDRAGLAHFLEHMLFMGTKTYPDEDAYERMLEEHNGSYNAYTADTRTVYYFDIHHAALRKITPLFAGFFTEPLLAAGSVNREMKAVNSEHQKNLQSDPWRVSELVGHLSNKSHPRSKFGTGNLDTLGDPKPSGEPTSSDKPKTLDKLWEFYRTYYSSEKMCMSVLGRESLDELEQLVREYFSKVPKAQQPAPPLNPPTKPFDDTKKAYKVQTVQDSRSIQLTWQLDNFSQHATCNPSHYCSSVIGYEGEGSLFSYLKPLGCISLSAGKGTENTNFSEFDIHVELTNTCDKMTEIVNLCIGYVQLLANDMDHEKRYGLVSRLSMRRFDYSSEPSPSNLVQSMAISLEKHQDEFLLASTPRNYDEKVMRDYINQLCGSYPTVYLLSKDPLGDSPRSEPVYGTLFEEVDYVYTPQTTSEFYLRPATSPFEPDTLDLVDEVPVCLQKSPVNLWFYQSTQFKVPKSHISVNLYNDQFCRTPSARLSLKLYTDLFMDSLNELLYDASEAGLNVNMQVGANNFGIHFSGYNAGIPALMEHVLEKLLTFDLDKSSYERNLEGHAIDCKSFLMSSPYGQLLSALRRKRVPSLFSSEQMLQANSQHTFEVMQSYRGELGAMLSRAVVRMAVYGNERPEQALAYSKLVETQLNVGEVAAHVSRKVQPDTAVPTSDIDLQLKNPDETNVAFGYFFHVGDRREQFRQYCQTLLLGTMLSQPFFDSLRTKQQLGYIVFCRFTREYNDYGIGMMAQAVAKDYSVEKIQPMFNEFVQETAPTLLKNMSQAEFQNLKKSLIHKLTQRPKSMHESYSVMLSEIMSYQDEPDFGRIGRIAETVETLKFSEINTFYSEQILNKTPVRLNTSVSAATEAPGAVA